MKSKKLHLSLQLAALAFMCVANPGQRSSHLESLDIKADHLANVVFNIRNCRWRKEITSSGMEMISNSCTISFVDWQSVPVRGERIPVMVKPLVNKRISTDAAVQITRGVANKIGWKSMHSIFRVETSTSNTANNPEQYISVTLKEVIQGIDTDYNGGFFTAKLDARTGELLRFNCESPRKCVNAHVRVDPNILRKVKDAYKKKEVEIIKVSYRFELSRSLKPIGKQLNDHSNMLVIAVLRKDRIFEYLDPTTMKILKSVDGRF